MTKTIVAIGGGSFRTYPGNALDTWLLARTGQTRPKVAFLPTASGDQEAAIEAFTRSFLERGAIPTTVRLFVRASSQVSSALPGYVRKLPPPTATIVRGRLTAA